MIHREIIMYNRFMSQTIIVTLVLWKLICGAIHVNTSCLMHVVVCCGDNIVEQLRKFLYLYFIHCMCMYIWYDTTKQWSPHLFIYNCIVLYCTDIDKPYIHSHEVNRMNLWNKTCMLFCCVIFLKYVTILTDVRCIIDLDEPLDITLLGLLR
jgi:hypothetical protein